MTKTKNCSQPCACREHPRRDAAGTPPGLAAPVEVTAADVAALRKARDRGDQREVARLTEAARTRDAKPAVKAPVSDAPAPRPAKAKITDGAQRQRDRLANAWRADTDDVHLERLVEEARRVSEMRSRDYPQVRDPRDREAMIDLIVRVDGLDDPSHLRAQHDAYLTTLFLGAVARRARSKP